MNRRELLTGAALLGSAAQANAFGIGRLGLGEGRLGSLSAGNSAVPLSPLVLPTGPLAVWSMTKNTGWAGAAIRVVRASDSAQMDIGFVNNVLDTATMNTFMGASTLTVTKVYDQSGNGFDLAQSNPTFSPEANGTIDGAPIFDVIIPTTGNVVQGKIFQFPTGISFSTGSSSIYLATRPKSGIWNNSFFTFNGTTAFWDMYTFNSNPGTLAGVRSGSAYFTSNIVPNQNGSVIGLIGNGTAGSVLVDGAVGATFTVTNDAIATSTTSYLGALAGFPQFGSQFNFLGMVIYNRTLSGAEQTAINTALTVGYGLPQSYNKQIILDGDSITQSFGTSLNVGWPRSLSKAFPSYRMINLGIPGQTMATMAGNVATKVVARFQSGYSKNILVVWAGTNDVVAGATAATIYANLQSETAAAKTAGFKVVWATMLPRTDLTSGMQTVWAAYNALIRGATLGQSNTADALADVQSDATMGPFSAAANNTLYCNTSPTDFSIGVHPTNLGTTFLVPYFVAAVGSL